VAGCQTPHLPPYALIHQVKFDRSQFKVDQRFYVTGCDKLAHIASLELTSITADIAVITQLPSLKSVRLPALDKFTQSTNSDGLGLFAITDNANLAWIELGATLAEPRFSSFKGNAVACPEFGPYWATNCNTRPGQLPLRAVRALFFNSVCPNDDDHNTQSDWERNICSSDGNDNLRVIHLPRLTTVAVVEGGGWLLTTDRKLKQLSFPKLTAIGKVRDLHCGSEELGAGGRSRAGQSALGQGWLGPIIHRLRCRPARSCGCSAVVGCQLQ
jgi:hypothetical protein